MTSLRSPWPILGRDAGHSGSERGGETDDLELGRAEQEDRRAATLGAHHLQPSAHAGGPLPHTDQAVADAATAVEALSLVGYLDEERPGVKRHLHPADRRTGVPAHVGQRLAHNLCHHLALLRGQQVLGPAGRELDANRVKARELIGLAPEVARKAVRPDGRWTQVGQRLPDVLEQPLHDLEDVLEGLVGLASATFQVDLEKRDCTGQVGRDPVVKLSRYARSLTRHGILYRLVGETIVGWPDFGPGFGHRITARRLA